MTQPPSPDPSQQPAGQPPAYGAPMPPAGPPPQAPSPYGAPPQPATYAQQAPPAYAPPQPPAPYGAPPVASPYLGQSPHAPAPQAPSPYGAPPQAPSPYGYQQPDPVYGYQQQPSPPYVAPTEQLFAPPEPPGLPPISRPKKRPSGWNAPAFGIVGILLVVVLVGLVWPQLRARRTESAVRPLVGALAKRDAGARCPRYLTAVLTNVGSVQFDESGRIADRTDLTGPVCDGLRHLYSPGGRQELSCLTTGGLCNEDARRSVVAISVVVHESMHLGGQLDERGAECDSLAQSDVIAKSLGIPLDQARMISWLHWAAMNPNTPPQYSVDAHNCANVKDLEDNPPGELGARESLAAQIEATWMDVAT